MNKLQLNNIFKPLRLEKESIPVLKNYVIKNNKIIATDTEIQITIDLDENIADSIVGLDFGRSEHCIEDVPTLSFRAEKYNSFKATVSELKAMIEFASKEATRYYICGMHVNKENQELVATDGNSLAMLKKEITGNDNFKAIIPAELLKIVINTANKLKQKEVEIKTTDTRCIITMSGAEIIGKNITGKFPDYRSLVKSNNKYTAGFVITKDQLKTFIDKYKVEFAEKGKWEKLECGKVIRRIYAYDVCDGLKIRFSDVKRFNKTLKTIKANEFNCRRQKSDIFPFELKCDGLSIITMPMKL